MSLKASLVINVDNNELIVLFLKEIRDVDEEIIETKKVLIQAIGEV